MRVPEGFTRLACAGGKAQTLSWHLTDLSCMTQACDPGLVSKNPPGIGTPALADSGERNSRQPGGRRNHSRSTEEQVRHLLSDTNTEEGYVEIVNACECA